MPTSPQLFTVCPDQGIPSHLPPLPPLPPSLHTSLLPPAALPAPPRPSPLPPLPRAAPPLAPVPSPCLYLVNGPDGERLLLGNGQAVGEGGSVEGGHEVDLGGQRRERRERREGGGSHSGYCWQREWARLGLGLLAGRPSAHPLQTRSPARRGGSSRTSCKPH